MPNNEKLWQKYKEQDDMQAREALILEHINLVRYAAGRISVILPDHIDRDDLESYGIIGLIEAVENFDWSRNINFSTFALPRIKGEIFDHLRSQDWLPSSMRRQIKLIEERKLDFKNDQGRDPSNSELAEIMNMDIEKIEDILYRKYLSDWISLSYEYDGSELIQLIDSGADKPVSKMEEEDAVELLAEKIDSLKEREKLLVQLYYYEELTQLEIAEIMDISPARVSQLHKQIVRRLRGMLSRSKEYFF
ncbi:MULTISPECIES: sigma-70 family RNA polymerase sigma factor [unclassified Halanaerobium]|uniref:sigma-70 family RNA polymerase sigma factor n=1 Tax=unclassified Halanaerobium TaxID=2641197 RepID=UPI000DF1524E|nr:MULTISPECIES: FliA/WhiG family RNA polymerase sigma factor [unclassified Halanaerobium]RCW47669.1 RNA polymerase sigma-28 (SigD/FliA/WhiG) subunit [Halanaerobium sp. MA284_MarDTE_T2]RCW84687.1 RNA polymerase sigma-28 (SigD/FliA/WhiG) subunit [Halanaerobium sp. DL-01]